jgi:octaprenyl-diphosphate synthase
MAKEMNDQNKARALSPEAAYALTPLVEFVHTASLIHDDIEDNADLRRGKAAAHISYGLDTALNSASWLYFEAPVCLQSSQTAGLTDGQRLTFYKLYTNELRRLHLGQAMDIFWHRNAEVFPAKQEYLAMVKNKTGTLASLAAKLGCIAGGLSAEEAERFGAIAADIGIGFQIIDDVINLTTGNPGKKRGDDIVEGKKSLPVLIHTTEHPEDKHKIADYMKEAAAKGIEAPAVEQCISLLETSGCIKKAAEQGRILIEEGCARFNSDQIKELFTSMIPENFRC